METTLNRHGYCFRVNRSRYDRDNQIQTTILEYKKAEREVIKNVMEDFLDRELIDEDFNKIQIVHSNIKDFERLEYSTLAYNGEPLGRIKTEFFPTMEGGEEVRIEFTPLKIYAV